MSASQRELDVLLEQYRALRAELLVTMTSTRGVLQLSLIALGVLVAAAPKIAEEGYPASYLFLAIPLVFYGLSLTFLRYMLLHTEVVEHIHYRISPRVRQLLARDGDYGGLQCEWILSWEDEAGYKGPLSRYQWWCAPIPYGPQLVPLFGAALSVVGFFFVDQQALSGMSTREWWFVGILCGVHALALSYFAFAGTKVGVRGIKTSDVREKARNWFLQD